MSPYTALVMAMPQMAEALTRSGQFALVKAPGSTGELHATLTQLTPGADDKVFLFSDVTPVDTQVSLDTLLQFMTTHGARIVIVGATPSGQRLAEAHPGVGYLPAPVRVNDVIGALSGMGIGDLHPVPENENLELDTSIGAGPLAQPKREAPPVIPMPSAAEDPFSPTVDANPFAAPTPTPAAEPGAGNPFGAPTPAPEAEVVNPFAAASSQAPPNPFGAPAPSTPSEPEQPVADPAASGSNPFAQPQPPVPEPQHSPAVAQTFAAPAPEAAPSPFGAPAAQQPPASPFGAPAPQQAAPSPFGAPAAEQAPASPFGAPAAPAPAAPFGAPVTGASPFAATPAAGAPSPFGAGAASQASGASPFGGGPIQPRVGAAAVQPAAGAGKCAKVIVMTVPKGGTGKSTLSLNLAIYLGLRLRGTGKTVAMIDANVQQADIGKYMGAFTPNIEDLYRDAAAIHPDRIGEYLHHKREWNLSVLLGPLDPDEANPTHYSGERYSQILEAMRPNFDYIIVDTPVAEHFHDLFRKFALPKADSILVPVTPNQVTILNTDAWLSSITKPVNAGGHGVPPEKVGIILNRYEEALELGEEDVRLQLHNYRYLGAIPEVLEWKEMANKLQVIATMNYTLLNEAMSNILYQATGEELLAITSTSLPEDSSGGLARFFSNLFKKKAV